MYLSVRWLTGTAWTIRHRSLFPPCELLVASIELVKHLTGDRSRDFATERAIRYGTERAIRYGAGRAIRYGDTGRRMLKSLHHRLLGCGSLAIAMEMLALYSIVLETVQGSKSTLSCCILWLGRRSRPSCRKDHAQLRSAANGYFRLQ